MTTRLRLPSQLRLLCWFVTAILLLQPTFGYDGYCKSGIAPSTSIGYGGQSDLKISYNFSLGVVPLDYDGVGVLVADERENQSPDDGVLLANLAKFLAAERVGIGTTEFGGWAGNAPLNARVAGFQESLLAEGRVAFGRGDLTLADIGNISSGLEREVAITRVGQTRYLQLSGTYGGDISLGKGEKLIGHVHFGEGYWGLGRSAFGTDFESMGANGIFNQAVLNESGAFRIIRANGSMSTIFNIPPAP